LPIAPLPTVNMVFELMLNSWTKSRQRS